jgi:hypothetical protein
LYSAATHAGTESLKPHRNIVPFLSLNFDPSVVAKHTLTLACCIRRFHPSSFATAIRIPSPFAHGSPCSAIRIPSATILLSAFPVLTDQPRTSVGVDLDSDAPAFLYSFHPCPPAPSSSFPIFHFIFHLYSIISLISYTAYFTWSHI